MDTFLNLVISGIVTGAIYSIMASGLVLTYQTSGIFNFAHGAIAFATAYFYYQLHTGQGVPIIPAAILAVLIFAPLMGIVLDAILLRRLASAPIYARIVGTIGLLVALPNLCLWLVETLGDDVLGLDLPKVSDLAGVGGHAPGIGPDPSHVYHPFGWLGLDKIHINSDQLAVFIAAIIAAVLLWYVVRKTRSGLEMRAVVDRDTLAALRGINQSRSSQIAWILTMILAGLGGILITPLFQLNPDLFTLVVLGSLAAVAISGLRSIPIAFAGGILLGVVQNLVAGYKDDILPGFLDRISGLASSVPFFLTLVLLFFIARDRSRAAGSMADTRPPPDHRAGLPAWRRRLPWVLVTIAILGFALQWINVAALQADTYEQAQIALGLVYAIIFLSFVVVTGLGGMVSLAQSTFVIAGGFAAGWALNRDWGDIPVIAPHGQLNFALCALIGALCAAAIGALIALPVRRLGAVALALATFALAFVASLIPFDYDPIAKGSFGWPFTGTKGIPPSQVDRALPSLNIDGAFGWLRSIVDPGQRQVVRLLPAPPAGDPRARGLRLHHTPDLLPAAFGVGPGDARDPQQRGRGAHVRHQPREGEVRGLRPVGRDRRLRRRHVRRGQRLDLVVEREPPGRSGVAGGRGDLRGAAPGRRAARRAQLLVHRAHLPVARQRHRRQQDLPRPHDRRLLHADPVRPRCHQPREEPRRSAVADR